MSIRNAKRKNAMDKYKTLALNTVIFAVGSFGSKILLFFLTRLYTGNIISDNLNTKEMLEITANFLIPVFTFSIAEAVMPKGDWIQLSNTSFQLPAGGNCYAAVH